MSKEVKVDAPFPVSSQIVFAKVPLKNWEDQKEIEQKRIQVIAELLASEELADLIEIKIVRDSVKEGFSILGMLRLYKRKEVVNED